MNEKKKKEYMSYATGHNSFTRQYLLNIYIYCRFCRLCIISVWKKHILNLVVKETVAKINSILILLLYFILGPRACFPSELIWIYGSYRQIVGLLGRMMSPVASPLSAQDNINTQTTLADIHTSKGIRTHDPSVWAGEDISCLVQPGHCDMQFYANKD
jgi:hypothetical protein